MNRNTQSAMMSASTRYAQLWNELRSGGMDAKDAAGVAWERVAKERGMSREELHREHSAWMRKIQLEKTAQPTAQLAQPEVMAVAPVYRAWCAEHDFVPTDAILAHFMSNATAETDAFKHARARMKNEGYIFEKVDNGWKVTKPKKTYTEDEVKKAIEAAIRSLK